MSEDTLSAETQDAEPVVVSDAEPVDGDAEDNEAQAAEQDDGQSEASEGDGGEPGDQDEPEEIEFTFGNEKVAFAKGDLPPEVVEKLDSFTKGTWADYTRKSQEVSEQRKAVEAAKQSADKLLNMSQEMLATYAQGETLKAGMQQIQSQLTDELWQRDPDRARQLDNQLARTRTAFQQSLTKLSQQEAQTAEAQQTQRREAVEAGSAQLRKDVPNFDAELPKVIDFAVKEMGIDRKTAEADYALNPTITKWAYEAMKYREMRAKAAAGSKRPAQTTEVKATKGQGASKPTRDPAKMSMEEYAKWRDAQERATRNRR